MNENIDLSNRRPDAIIDDIGKLSVRQTAKNQEDADDGNRVRRHHGQGERPEATDATWLSLKEEVVRCDEVVVDLEEKLKIRRDPTQRVHHREIRIRFARNLLTKVKHRRDGLRTNLDEFENAATKIQLFWHRRLPVIQRHRREDISPSSSSRIHSSSKDPSEADSAVSGIPIPSFEPFPGENCSAEDDTNPWASPAATLLTQMSSASPLVARDSMDQDYHDQDACVGPMVETVQTDVSGTADVAFASGDTSNGNGRLSFSSLGQIEYPSDESPAGVSIQNSTSSPFSDGVPVDKVETPSSVAPVKLETSDATSNPFSPESIESMHIVSKILDTYDKDGNAWIKIQYKGDDVVYEKTLEDAILYDDMLGLIEGFSNSFAERLFVSKPSWICLFPRFREKQDAINEHNDCDEDYEPKTTLEEESDVESESQEAVPPKQKRMLQEIGPHNAMPVSTEYYESTFEPGHRDFKCPENPSDRRRSSRFLPRNSEA